MGNFMREKGGGMVYKSLQEIDFGPHSQYLYVHSDVKAPRMTGLLVKVFAWGLEAPIFGGILSFFLKKNNLVHKLVSFASLQESPHFTPSHPYQESRSEDTKYLDADMSPPEKVQQAVDCLSPPIPRNPNFRRWTIMDYARAYTSGETTPTMVARRFIAFLQESSSKDLQMSFFINSDAEDILKQAAESTARYKRGEPISVLDGVPVAVKDEIDCLPYPTTGGTKWMHRVRKCTNDASCVSRLRSCGAMIVGKTNMHELGGGISGINPHYGAARNPYNRRKITGGSSSGSAAVVAAGLCPVALGVDGGGSVRLPAALCGVVGMKPTFACVPHDGVLPLNYTIGMVGILAATVEDALIAYAAIGGDASSRPFDNPVPKIGLPELKSANYSSLNIKMARYEKWFDDCSDNIRTCCSDAVANLCETYGWKTVDVTILDIESMRLAHYVTLATECSNAISGYLDKLNRQLEIHRKIFSMADVIVTPSTGVTAYTIEDDAVATGELDYINGAGLVRYMIAGNFLGLPAITVPVGYDSSGLPIGVQFIGKPWSESLLMYIASAMQTLCLSEQKKPEVFYDMLADD
ncbi:fatty acid amide hydrolase-like isoform X2 [Andrographis paniculata]|uniref:fatty acid amide hydrolase-like isoform X2 n=1 Tax=Andrographis paniculata TaxID=175694 RepID=UPI0021E82072|nr:fatty acid amide hydrolase-like isoform X2 [Andrographis paniculata]